MSKSDSFPRRQSFSSWLGLCLLCSVGCSVLSDVELGAGFGKHCQTSADCQSAECIPSTLLSATESGICASRCTTATDCPDGTSCAGGLCQIQRTVGFALPESVKLSEPRDVPSYLSLRAHVDAAAQLSKSVPYVVTEQKFPALSGNMIAELRALAMRNEIVIGHTPEVLPNLNILAAELPARSFFAVNGGTYYQLADRGPRVGTLWVRREEAWFVAGRLAGSAAAKRIGVIAGAITPETIRNINAFTLGARRQNASIKVEVRYLGATADLNSAPTYDYKDIAGTITGPKLYREELLARQLVDNGCEVIGDMSSNQRAMKLLTSTVNPTRTSPLKKIPVLVSGIKDGCLTDSGTADKDSCMGAVYDNWSGIYQRAVETVHRQLLAPGTAVEAAMSNDTESAVGVAINSVYPNALDFDARVGDYIDELLLQPAGKRVFIGPLKANGQRDADDNTLPDASQQVAAGVVLSDAEVATMCYFVDGVVEPWDTGKKDGMGKPVVEERAAVVPGGLVPGATTLESEASLPMPLLDKLALPDRQSSSCRKNAKWIYRTNG